MLSDQYFYHRLLRKYIITFGNLFNNITMIKTTTDTGVEINRIKVPISYAPKDKWITRLNQDPDYYKELQSILPRMSFALTGMAYDAPRQQNNLLKTVNGESSSRVASQFMGVPFNFDFDLYVLARNIDDGNHIIEQILPFVVPDYTVQITPVPQMGYVRDIPIVFNGIKPEITWEGNFDSTRVVMWTLSFTLKGYLYGPISNPKIIRKSIVNIFNDPSLNTGYTIRINTGPGNNGTFQLDDIVFQGSKYETASAFGIVTHWEPGSNKLVISGTQGQWKTNNTIKAVSTNASYTLESFDVNPIKLAQVTVEPNPINAEPEDDYGYTETWIEYGDPGSEL